MLSPHNDPDFVRHPVLTEEEIEFWRQMPPGEKLNRVFELSEALLEATKADVRRRYPDADEREVFLRTAAIRLGRELSIKVYGWDPAAHD